MEETKTTSLREVEGKEYFVTTTTSEYLVPKEEELARIEARIEALQARKEEIEAATSE